MSPLYVNNSDAIFSNINLFFLSALLLIATYSDIKNRRIPNWLVVTGLFSSLGINLFFGGPGIMTWCLGCVMGFILFFPLYAVRAMGAGDVKLMAAIGSFVGPLFVTGVAVATLIAGGMLALIFAALHGNLIRTLSNVRATLMLTLIRVTLGETQLASMPTSTGTMPYAVAISAGTVIYLVLDYFGHGLTL